MGKQQMTLSEQAALMWPMLALAARNQQILSYAAVEGFTGIARQGLGESRVSTFFPSAGVRLLAVVSSPRPLLSSR